MYNNRIIVGHPWNCISAKLFFQMSTREWFLPLDRADCHFIKYTNSGEKLGKKQNEKVLLRSLLKIKVKQKPKFPPPLNNIYTQSPQGSITHAYKRNKECRDGFIIEIPFQFEMLHDGNVCKQRMAIVSILHCEGSALKVYWFWNIFRHGWGFHCEILASFWSNIRIESEIFSVFRAPQKIRGLKRCDQRRVFLIYESLARISTLLPWRISEISNTAVPRVYII